MGASLRITPEDQSQVNAHNNDGHQDGGHSRHDGNVGQLTSRGCIRSSRLDISSSIGTAWL